MEDVVNSILRKGLATTPSFIEGSWGKSEGGIRGCYFEARTSSDSGATWSAWTQDYSWEQYVANTTDYIEYRWRMPLPHSGYFRIEWDEMNFPGYTGFTVASLVIDDCYNNIPVRQVLPSLTFQANLPDILTTQGDRARHITGSYSLIRAGGTGHPVVVSVSATDILLAGISNKTTTGNSAELASGWTNIGFSPNNSAAARARHAPLYNDSQSLSGLYYPAGAVLDSAGTAVTQRQVLSVNGHSPSSSLFPRYTGGDVSSVTLTSVPPSGDWDSFLSFFLLPTGFETGSTTPATIIRPVYSRSGLSYTAKSWEITDADLPSGYHPFIPSTWPVSTAYTLGPTSSDRRAITCPRFFLTP